MRFQLSDGDHLCVPYESDTVRQAVLRSYAAEGLDAGHHLILIERPFARGGLDRAVRTAAASGPIWLAADMTGARPPHPCVRELLDRNQPATTLCLYDQRQVSAELISRAFAAHPLIHDGRSLWLRRTSAGSLRLAGEVDLTNRAIWQAVIDSLIRAPEPLTVDTVGVTFIDVAGVWQLNRLIAQRPAGRTRILCGPITAAAAHCVAGADPSMCFGFTELDAA